MTRWFEDIAIDEPYALGTHTFTEAEIIAFSRAYDPQPVHLDPVGASGPHGGLVASGWHVASVCHRHMVDALAAEEKRLIALGQIPGVSGPSPGVNRLAFLAPVRPGDAVTFTLRVSAKRASNSLLGWGILTNQLDGVNQRGETVYTGEVIGFSKLRDYRMPARLRLLMALTKLPGLGKLLRKWN